MTKGRIVAPLFFASSNDGKLEKWGPETFDFEGFQCLALKDLVALSPRCHAILAFWARMPVMAYRFRARPANSDGNFPK